jgi:hypothetical protein
MRLTLVAGATIALLGSVAAQAADLPINPPPPVVAAPPPFVDPITALFQLIFSPLQPPPPPAPPVVRKY